MDSSSTQMTPHVPDGLGLGPLRRSPPSPGAAPTVLSTRTDSCTAATASGLTAPGDGGRCPVSTWAREMGAAALCPHGDRPPGTAGLSLISDSQARTLYLVSPAVSGRHHSFTHGAGGGWGSNKETLLYPEFHRKGRKTMTLKGLDSLQVSLPTSPQRRALASGPRHCPTAGHDL